MLASRTPSHALYLSAPPSADPVVVVAIFQIPLHYSSPTSKAMTNQVLMGAKAEIGAPWWKEKADDLFAHELQP